MRTSKRSEAQVWRARRLGADPWWGQEGEVAEARDVRGRISLSFGRQL